MRKLKTQEDPGKTVMRKIVFLVMLLITAVLINYISATIPEKRVKAEKQESRPILGVSTASDLTKVFGSDTLGIKKQTDAIKADLEKKLIKLVGEKTEGLESSISAVLYERAVGPVLSQFKALPPEHQEKVKELICK